MNSSIPRISRGKPRACGLGKLLSLCLVTLVISGGVESLAANQPGEITLAPVLGCEFGKIVEIEGRIVNDEDTRRREDLGETLIEVSRCGGQKLEKPVIIRLSFQWANTEKPDRGDIVRLRGYETGGFRGIPRDAFKDIPEMAGPGYGFQSWFEVTKFLERTKMKEPDKRERATPRETQPAGR